MNNERGIAMPMALIVMVILTALMAAFAVLATSEPQIASNQVASAQARALAESGVERALWGLTTGQGATPPTGSLVLNNYLMPSPVPAAYNGTEVALGVGSFKVTVANGAQLNQKLVTAIGYVPNATTPIATKQIKVTVTRISWINPVCGICAGGENPPLTAPTISVSGNATVNGTTAAAGTAPAGNFCNGVVPTSAVGSTGTVTAGGTANLYAPPGGTPTQNGASFPSTMILTDSDIATLKAMAMAKNTYYKGSVSWTSPPPNGIIFVDTLDGSVLSATTPAANVANVDISGNWSTGWSGWLIVAGNVTIHGNVSMSGLIYAQNDITLHGTGTGAIQGAVISTTRRDTSTTNVDITDTGNAPLSYNCGNVRNGGGSLSQNWFLVPGTYREVDVTGS